IDLVTIDLDDNVVDTQTRGLSSAARLHLADVYSCRNVAGEGSCRHDAGVVNPEAANRWGFVGNNHFAGHPRLDKLDGNGLGPVPYFETSLGTCEQQA